MVVYFGYIARITRAGTIAALDSDYTRTAYMKGLSTAIGHPKHVLRNSLQPTVAVTGTQIGYLFGGLVGLEMVFNYPGLGRLILNAATAPDFPLLQAGVITVAIIFMICTLARRPAHRLDESAGPTESEGVMTDIRPPEFPSSGDPSRQTILDAITVHGTRR